ncbi:hypothetical protein Zm00014a_019393 [Zea mays]|uniref:Uncharacterized protein n=1 Tax=Zea mays TaxID=4577 RepID=A0A3L6FXT4_MAIZE|nr:hypothetical protein Zm00014a_019393 [Zea mays]
MTGLACSLGRWRWRARWPSENGDVSSLYVNQRGSMRHILATDQMTSDIWGLIDVQTENAQSSQKWNGKCAYMLLIAVRLASSKLGSSSRDETSFEATPWLESDCEDDFYSVNEDLTPAGSFASRTSGRNTPPPRPRDLPTLAVILKAEPLKPPPPQRRLGDLLREAQDDDNDNDTAVDGLSRDDSLRMGAEANRCCVPRLAWAISCNGRTQRK